MAFQLDSDFRCYAQVTHPYNGLFPNTGGSSTVAAGDIVPIISFRVTSNAGLVNSQAKTIGLARTKGMAGRRSATWEAVFPWQPSGTAGTVPNLDPVLQAIFCAAPTVSAGVSVTYAFPSTAQPSQLSFFLFRTAGSNVFQRAVRGCVVNAFTIATSGEEATLTVSGTCAGEIDSVNFASYSTADKGGLTSFPTEPSSPTAVGSSIVAFIGSVSVDSVTSHSVESWSINASMNRGLQYKFGERTPSVPTARLRDLAYSLSIFEENTSALSALRFKWYNSTAVPVSFILGDVAGAIAAFTMATTVLPSEELDQIDGQSIVRWNAAQAYSSAVGQNDELVLTLT